MIYIRKYYKIRMQLNDDDTIEELGEKALRSGH